MNTFFSSKSYSIVTGIIIGIVIASVIVITILLTYKVAQKPSTEPNPAEKPTWFVFPSLTDKQASIGNQLFQVAATLGLAKDAKKSLCLHWPTASEYFEHVPLEWIKEPIPSAPLEHLVRLTETNPFACECLSDINPKETHSQVDGYRQHPGYFASYIPFLRHLFTFREDCVSQIYKALPCLRTHHCIGVQVGRQDLINQELPPSYYLFGISLFRAIFPNTQVILFSLEKQWCQNFLINVPRLQNAFVSPFEKDWQEFIAFSLCRHKIIANSSFGWWAAWLDNRWNSQVLAPSPWSQMEQHKEAWKALYHSQWFIYHWEAPQQIIQVPLKTQVEIGAYYPNLQTHLTTAASFRRVYPASTFVTTSSISPDVIQTYNLYCTHISVENPLYTDVANIVQAAAYMQQEYFIFLTDQVYVFRALEIPSEHMGADLICNCGLQIGMAYGGSLFRSSFWKSFDVSQIFAQLEEYMTLSGDSCIAAVLVYLCSRNQGVVKSSHEMYPSEFSSVLPGFGCPSSPAVLHPWVASF